MSDGLCSQLTMTTKLYILLTVHPGIILVNNHLDVQFFFLCLFQIFTCFEHLCAHHQEN
jgi:hypothetical protein